MYRIKKTFNDRNYMVFNSVIYALLIVSLTYKINPSQYKGKDVPYTAV